MFFERYKQLCESVGKSANAVAKELGIASPSVTQYKNGSVPRPTTLTKIANYFSVSVEYLLGETDEKTPAPIDEGRALSKEEQDLIEAFRLLPEEYQDGILAQIEAVLTRKGLLPPQQK